MRKKSKNSPKMDDQEQSEKFIKAARELCVDSGKEFSSVLDVIVKKPQKSKNRKQVSPKPPKE